MPSSAEASSSSEEPAVAKAHAAFQAAAKQQLKQLMASGVEGDTASVRLMDTLLSAHGAGPATASAACASPQLQHVVSVTGFSPLQAAKTLLLKEEISQMRRQGHGTTALIEQLQKRLRFASHSDSRSDENSSAPAALQPHKKLKRAEEGHADLVWPLPQPHATPGLRGALEEVPSPSKKKRRPEDAGSTTHKRPKPRLAACDASAPPS